VLPENAYAPVILRRLSLDTTYKAPISAERYSERNLMILLQRSSSLETPERYSESSVWPVLNQSVRVFISMATWRAAIMVLKDLANSPISFFALIWINCVKSPCAAFLVPWERTVTGPAIRLVRTTANKNTARVVIPNMSIIARRRFMTGAKASAVSISVITANSIFPTLISWSPPRTCLPLGP